MEQNQCTCCVVNQPFFVEIDSLLREGKTVTIPVRGNSMSPFLVDGRDWVVLQRTCRMETGNVVLACLPGNRYVLHRIYGKQDGRIILMGDGNLHVQEHCREEDVLGQAVEVIRCGRHVVCASVSERGKAWLWRKLLPCRRYLLFLWRAWRRTRKGGGDANT